ncbi:MAG: GtrA family protein [Bryobacteraceae bacterium]
MKSGETWSGLGLRWLKFNAVGAAGIVVQLAVLALLVSGLGLNYLVATALAVEAAVLHNFFWHQRFTWADRASASTRQTLDRLLRFNLTNGGLSILGNLVIMRLLVGRYHVQYVVANLITIAVCSVANFLVSHRFVFIR